MFLFLDRPTSYSLIRLFYVEHRRISLMVLWHQHFVVRHIIWHQKSFDTTNTMHLSIGGHLAYWYMRCWSDIRHFVATMISNCSIQFFTITFYIQFGWAMELHQSLEVQYTYLYRIFHCEIKKYFSWWTIFAGFLKKNPLHRLGCTGKESQIQNHIFFRNLDWFALEKRNVKPPFRPHH